MGSGRKIREGRQKYFKKGLDTGMPGHSTLSLADCDWRAASAGHLAFVGVEISSRTENQVPGFSCFQIPPACVELCTTDHPGAWGAVCFPKKKDLVWHLLAFFGNYVTNEWQPPPPPAASGPEEGVAGAVAHALNKNARPMKLVHGAWCCRPSVAQENS